MNDDNEPKKKPIVKFVKETTFVTTPNGHPLRLVESLARVKEHMCSGMLTQEFGVTDPRLFHDGP